MAMRRAHNPNRVVTAPVAAITIPYRGPELLPCLDCGVLTPPNAAGVAVCDDCECIRQTGEQCTDDNY